MTRVLVGCFALGMLAGLASCNGITWGPTDPPLPHDDCYWSYTYARGSTTVKTDSVYGCLHFVKGRP